MGTETYRNHRYECRLIDNAKGQGGWRVSTNLDTSEGDLFSILGGDERPSAVPVIQHSSELDDLQILIAHILDGGMNSQFGHRRNLVGRSGERNLKATSSANGGLSVSTDGRETKSDKRQRKHGDAKGSEGTGLGLGVFQPRHLILFIPLRKRDPATKFQFNSRRIDSSPVRPATEEPLLEVASGSGVITMRWLRFAWQCEYNICHPQGCRDRT